MKYFVKIFIAVVSLFSAFAVFAQGAANAGAPVYSVISTFEDAIFDSPIALVGGKVQSSATVQPLATTAVAAAGSAPPLTRVAVYAVGSTLYGGWEYMTTLGQLSTVGDHGGTQLRALCRKLDMAALR